MAWTQQQTMKIANAKTATFDSTPVQGNLLICVGCIRVDAGTFTAGPSGFSQAILNQPTASYPGVAVWYKIAGPSETKTITWTSDTSSGCGTCIIEYTNTGVSATVYDNSVSAIGSSAAPASGSLTCAQSNELKILGIQVRSTTAFSSWTDSFSEVGQVQTGSGGGASRLGVAERLGAGTSNGGCTSGNAAWRASQAAFKIPEGETISLSKAVLSIAGKAVKSNVRVIPTKATFQASGKSIKASETCHPAKGVLGFTGKSLTVITRITILLAKAALSWMGKSLKVNELLKPSKVALAWVGKALKINEACRPARATVNLLGKSLKINEALGLSKASIAWAGRMLKINETYRLTKALLSIGGKILMARQGATILLAKAALSWAGRALKINEVLKPSKAILAFAGRTANILEGGAIGSAFLNLFRRRRRRR